MENDYSVFSVLDDFKPYNGEDITMGEYLVNHFTVAKYSHMPVQKQIMSYHLVQYLLEENILSKDKIILFRKASYKVDCTHLKNFMTQLMEIFPRDIYDKHAKLLCNSFIGSLGKKFIHSDKGFITNDFETVCATFWQNADKENQSDFNFTNLGDLYFVRETTHTRMSKDHGPIFRQVLCQGMIQVFELLKLVHGPHSQLVGYNTDSVFVRRPNKVTLDKTKYKKEEWKPKMYKPFEVREGDDSVEPLTDWEELNDIQFKGQDTFIQGVKNNEVGEKYIDELKEKSFCCTGMPGCQKTTLLKKLYVKGETLVLCYTNKAWAQMTVGSCPFYFPEVALAAGATYFSQLIT